MGTETKTDELWHGYLLCIELAFEKGLSPIKLLNLIDAIKKTDFDLKIMVLAALNKFSRKNKFNSPRKAIVEFIKSKEFKEIIPARIAKSKKFFTSKSGTYTTRDPNSKFGMIKTLRTDLTFSEHTRYKFVENIYSEFKKVIKKKPSSAAGIASLLLPKSH